MKTIKWHKGIENLVSKKDYDNVIKDVATRGYYEANRNDFSLFCRRSERHNSWRDVVTTTLPRKADTIIESIASGGTYRLTKAELRKFDTCI